MQIKEALEKLFLLHNFGVKLGLENVQNFLDLAGNPQRYLKTFHIAGSNGKGSTSSFIASILTEAGYKTGLYTSPHFVKFNERIRINNIQVEDEFVAEFLTKYFDYIFANGLTFFEVTTVLAFEYFQKNKVDYAVIETGLGGRLDATNVITPLASVITSISLEHTNILGTTFAQIAGEKAGIIKPGVNTFIGKLPLEAESTIEKKCSDLNSNLFKLVNHLTERNGNLVFSENSLQVDDLSSPLKGEYQKYNAALAILTLQKSLSITDKKIISSGLKNVLLNSGLQGRYEYYSLKPAVIFDSAHNMEGIEVFLKEFENEKTGYKKRTLLFGAMRDKSVAEMLQKLCSNFDEIVFTQIDYERCATIEELNSIAVKINITAGSTMEPDKFIKNYVKYADSEECLVVLGSMYILGEIKTRFAK